MWSNVKINIMVLKYLNIELCCHVLASLSRHILQPHMFCMVQWAECLTRLMSTYKYLSEESIWRVPAFFHVLHPYLVHLVLSGSHSSRVHLLEHTYLHRKIQQTVRVHTGLHP